MDDASSDGDRAIDRWTLERTHTGPDGTGTHVRISGYEKWQIGPDGLIAASLATSMPPTTSDNSSVACELTPPL